MKDFKNLSVTTNFENFVIKSYFYLKNQYFKVNNNLSVGDLDQCWQNVDIPAFHFLHGTVYKKSRLHQQNDSIPVFQNLNSY